MAAKNDLTGIKFLITSGAIAGTIGGWILVSLAGGLNGGGTVQDPAIMDLLNRALPTLAKPNVVVGTSGTDPGAAPAAVQPTTVPSLRSVNNQPASPPVTNTQSSK
ncbi:MAG: hypothetical protein WBM17_07625 [Anaerolineales bacterium]